jgi:hypothetical protein
VVLVLLMVVCIPWMLVPKPLLERRDAMKHQAQYSELDEDTLADSDHGGHGGHGGKARPPVWQCLSLAAC